MLELSSAEEIQYAVKEHPQLRVQGGGSKPALSQGASLSLKGLSGVLAYDPQEYTFTALAGTPVSEVEAVLAENQQYMPFDPPLARAGATLGGTVAAGLSGPGRFRYGGVRDFLLGIAFVSGEGERHQGGGKVVKNAAGFDLPKLMVGSLGQFGILTEVTFKVFPKPEAFATLSLEVADLDRALELMQRLAASPLDLTCLELEPPSRIWLRVAGRSKALPQRLERVQTFAAQQGDTLQGDDEETFWQDTREFSWLPAGHQLIKLPLTPGRIVRCERLLSKLSSPVPRRYSVGGQLAWLAWPDTLGQDALAQFLTDFAGRALALTGSWPTPLLGKPRDQVFQTRLRSVLDPNHKFPLTPHPSR